LNTETSHDDTLGRYNNKQQQCFSMNKDELRGAYFLEVKAKVLYIFIFASLFNRT